MVKKKPFVQKIRNPADVRKGIKAENISFDQKTGKEKKKTAGEIVKEARKQAKSSGKSELQLIKEMSEAEQIKHGGSEPIKTTGKEAIKITTKKEGKVTGEKTITDLEQDEQQAVRSSLTTAEQFRERRREANQTAVAKKGTFDPAGTGEIRAAPAPPESPLERAFFELERERGKFTAERVSKESKGETFIPGKGLVIGAGLSVVGTALFAKNVATDPIGTGKGIIESTVSFAKDPYSTGGKLKNIIINEPEIATGFVLTEIATAKFTGALVKKIPIKVKVGRVVVPVKESVPVFKEISAEGKLVLSSPTQISTVKKITTIGIETPTRGLNIASKVKGVSEVKLSIGKPKLSPKIPLSDLQSAIPAPKLAIETKALVNVLDLTPAEITRVKSLQSAGRILRKEKGLKVKDVIFATESFKDPIKASKLIEKQLAPEKAVIFGSGLTAPATRVKFFGLVKGEKTAGVLPKGFGSFTASSDIDVFFPKLTMAEIQPKVSKLAMGLQEFGEDIRVSTKSANVLEDLKGQKVAEFKSGIDQELLPGESPAPAGGLGFKFPDIKAGQLGKTTRFGKFNAITIGEQFTRKEVASAFFRPADVGSSTPKAFQGAGVFPIGRRTKDISGALITGRGIVARRRSSVFRPFTEPGSIKAEGSLNKFLGTFTSEQQADILTKTKELGEFNFAIKTGKTTTPSTSTGFKSPTLGKVGVTKGGFGSRISINKEFGGSPSPKIKGVVSRSPVIPSNFTKSVFGKSPSPSPARSKVSKSLSPSSFSKSPSKSPSPFRSPSPFKSPSSSVGSKISRSVFGSGSPSRSGSPSSRLGSSSISQFKGKYVPPSSISFNKFPRLGTEETKKKKKKKERKTKFTPSLIAIEGRIKGKKPKVLTGLEIRKIVS